MKQGGQGAGVVLVMMLAAAAISGTVYTIYLVGAETMTTILYVLAGAIGTGIVLAALALPIRAWRKNDNPPVIERYYHDGTRTIVKERIDGRAIEAPKLYQLPAQAQNGGAFPELLRAAYQAGVAGAHPQANRRAEPLDAEHHELTEPDPDGPAGWGGEIRP